MHVYVYMYVYVCIHMYEFLYVCPDVYILLHLELVTIIVEPILLSLAGVCGAIRGSNRGRKANRCCQTSFFAIFISNNFLILILYDLD